MNTEIIIHPKLQHVGLTTPNLKAMLDWYREAIGLTVNHLEVRAVCPIHRRLRRSRLLATTR